MNGCDPYRDLLCDYLDGEMPAAQREALARHLQSCPACQEELEGLKEVAEAVKALPRTPAPPRVLAAVREGLRAGAAPAREETQLRPASFYWRTGWLSAAAVVMLSVLIYLAYAPHVPHSEMPLPSRGAPQSDHGGAAGSRIQEKEAQPAEAAREAEQNQERAAAAARTGRSEPSRRPNAAPAAPARGTAEDKAQLDKLLKDMDEFGRRSVADSVARQPSLQRDGAPAVQQPAPIATPEEPAPAGVEARDRKLEAAAAQNMNKALRARPAPSDGANLAVQTPAPPATSAPAAPGAPADVVTSTVKEFRPAAPSPAAPLRRAAAPKARGGAAPAAAPDSSVSTPKPLTVSPPASVAAKAEAPAAGYRYAGQTAAKSAPEPQAAAPSAEAEPQAPRLPTAAATPGKLDAGAVSPPAEAEALKQTETADKETTDLALVERKAREFKGAASEPLPDAKRRGTVPAEEVAAKDPLADRAKNAVARPLAAKGKSGGATPLRLEVPAAALPEIMDQLQRLAATQGASLTSGEAYAGPSGGGAGLGGASSGGRAEEKTVGHVAPAQDAERAQAVGGPSAPAAEPTGADAARRGIANLPAAAMTKRLVFRVPAARAADLRALLADYAASLPTTFKKSAAGPAGARSWDAVGNAAQEPLVGGAGAARDPLPGLAATGAPRANAAADKPTASAARAEPRADQLTEGAAPSAGSGAAAAATAKPGDLRAFGATEVQQQTGPAGPFRADEEVIVLELIVVP